MHKKRIHDLFIDYKFTKESAKLLIPNWCADCENKENDDYKEDELYYKFKSFQSDPECDYNYNTLRLDGFEQLEYEDSNFNCDNIEDDLEVIFEASHLSLHEFIKLIIIYTRCSRKEYETMKNKVG